MHQRIDDGALRQSVFRQHETAQVRRLLNKALRVHGLTSPAVCAIVLGIMSNVANASDTESSDEFEIVRARADAPSRINMTVMVLTFACGTLMGWIMHMLVPPRADDDEPNVPVQNETTGSCDQHPIHVASVSECLSTMRVTLFEVGWERITTWMFMIAMTLRLLFCNCFSRSPSLGSGYATAQVEVASKGVNANLPRGPVQAGNQSVLPGAVRVTKTGKHYHHESCGHVRNGVTKRYTPCSFCRNEFLDG